MIQFLKLLKTSVNFEKNRSNLLFKDYSLSKVQKIKNQMFSGLVKKKSIKISIVGTNGKGSTSHFLNELGILYGFKTGLYTSPHLITEFERIQINHKNTSAKKLNAIISSFSPKLIDQLKSLTYFEILTVFAMFQFDLENCFLQIFEAGLGGKFDTTKLANAQYVVVTKIGFDHEKILGNSLLEILKNKLAITTRNTKIIFSLVQENQKLNQFIKLFCEKNNIKLYFFTNQRKLTYLENNANFSNFILKEIVKNEKLKITIPLKLELSLLPGRMEILNTNPLIIYDVAHNFDAVKFLFQSIQQLYPDTKFHILIGFLKDKKTKKIIDLIKNEKFIQKVYFLNSSEFKNFENFLPVKQEKILSTIYNSRNNFLIFGSFRLYKMIKI